MDHYIDFHILPDPEFNSSTLMNVLFSKFHLALVELDGAGYGVSFPRFIAERPSLGDCMRVHGSSANLEDLLSQGGLSGMRDYVRSGRIEAVPGRAMHCRVRRVQPKSNVERLRRRYMKRHGVSAEEAERRFSESVEQRVRLPYLQVRSRSTDRHFRLFIEHSEPGTQAVLGEFNSYGLSRTATVPWF